MHEYHYIRYHFVRRSDCTYIIYHGPDWMYMTLTFVMLMEFYFTTWHLIDWWMPGGSGSSPPPLLHSLASSLDYIVWLHTFWVFLLIATSANRKWMPRTNNKYKNVVVYLQSFIIQYIVHTQLRIHPMVQTQNLTSLDQGRLQDWVLRNRPTMAQPI